MEITTLFPNVPVRAEKLPESAAEQSVGLHTHGVNGRAPLWRPDRGDSPPGRPTDSSADVPGATSWHDTVVLGSR